MSSDNQEILPPEQETDNSSKTNINLAFINLINNPEKYIESVEKNNPGFIKNVTDYVLEFAKDSMQARMNFSWWQTYGALFIRTIAALVVLSLFGGFLYFLIFELRGNISSMLASIILLSLIVLYAVTQGGKTGFQEIISALASRIKK